MKVSLKHLSKALDKIKYGILGYSDDKDMVIDIEMLSGDPGNGTILDTISIKGSGVDRNDSTQEISISVQVYSENEKIVPTGAITTTFKVKL